MKQRVQWGNGGDTVSLDKAIEYGKEHRKRYYGNKAWDRSCRNHGGCSWCEAGRQHANVKARMKADASYDEYIFGVPNKEKKEMVLDLSEKENTNDKSK